MIDAEGTVLNENLDFQEVEYEIEHTPQKWTIKHPNLEDVKIIVHDTEEGPRYEIDARSWVKYTGESMRKVCRLIQRAVEFVQEKS